MGDKLGLSQLFFFCLKKLSFCDKMFDKGKLLFYNNCKRSICSHDVGGVYESQSD